MAKGGRPPLPWGKNKNRDPNRRRIVKRGEVNLKDMSDEERKEYIRTAQKIYIDKLKSDDERLEYLKEPPILLRRDPEPYDEFIKRVKKKNSERLTEILNDKELMWRIFADRDDLSTIEKDTMREKAKENKKYISDKEVDEVMNHIYGSGKEPIWKDEEEESEYHNPYDEA